MMNVRGIVYSSLVSWLCCLPVMGQVPAPDGVTSIDKLPETILAHDLCDGTVLWLDTRSEADAAKCDELAKALLRFPQLMPRTYFRAAQSAWWRGQREAALAWLNKAIEQRGDKPSPDFVIPVKVVARLWIGTMARYSGSWELAQSTYEKTLEILVADQSIPRSARGADAIVICHLYLAEIEARQRGNREKAISHLRTAEAVKVDEKRSDEIREVYERWARYERIKATSGSVQANQQLPADRSLDCLPFAMSIHFSLTGLTANPLAEGCQRGAKLDLIGQAIRKQVLESDVSPTDKMACRVLSGLYYQLKKDLPEAAKRYKEVFDEDSFVSASAGLLAAGAMRAQGREKEAQDVLERMAARYSQLKPLIEKAQKSEK